MQGQKHQPPFLQTSWQSSTGESVGVQYMPRWSSWTGQIQRIQTSRLQGMKCQDFSCLSLQEACFSTLEPCPIIFLQRQLIPFRPNSARIQPMIISTTSRKPKSDAEAGADAAPVVDSSSSVSPPRAVLPYSPTPARPPTFGPPRRRGGSPSRRYRGRRWCCGY